MLTNRCTQATARQLRAGQSKRAGDAVTFGDFICKFSVFEYDPIAVKELISNLVSLHYPIMVHRCIDNNPFSLWLRGIGARSGCEFESMYIVGSVTTDSRGHIISHAHMVYGYLALLGFSGFIWLDKKVVLDIVCKYNNHPLLTLLALSAKIDRVPYIYGTVGHLPLHLQCILHPPIVTHSLKLSLFESYTVSFHLR